jgi:hypothetical protein
MNTPTIAGSVRRWARLRDASGNAATVTRTLATDDAAPVYIVERPDHTFAISTDWRDALRVAAESLVLAVALGGNGQTWD